MLVYYMLTWTSTDCSNIIGLVDRKHPMTSQLREAYPPWFNPFNGILSCLQSVRTLRSKSGKMEQWTENRSACLVVSYIHTFMDTGTRFIWREPSFELTVQCPTRAGWGRECLEKNMHLTIPQGELKASLCLIISLQVLIHKAESSSVLNLCTILDTVLIDDKVFHRSNQHTSDNRTYVCICILYEHTCMYQASTPSHSFYNL